MEAMLRRTRRLGMAAETFMPHLLPRAKKKDLRHLP